MSTPKGYSSTQKLDREEAQFATMSPIGDHKRALDVRDLSTVTSIASDAAEAGSTVEQIVATAHLAKIGDRIRFTSGIHTGIEVDVIKIDTNNIFMGADLASAPAALDAFDILRPISLTVSPTGELTIASAPIQFKLDGVDTEVLEDTVTPANNVPLPVKITSATGDINITANDLNVQLSDQGVNADVTRIGDGTTQLEITLSNEAKVSDASAQAKLDTLIASNASIDTSMDVALSTRASESTLSALNLKVTTCDTDDVTISSSALPVGAATETTLASLNGKVTAVDTGAVTVAASALPAGAMTQVTGVDILNELALKADLTETQPVSLASAPLPTDAATQTTLAALLAELALKADLTETQPVSSASLPLPSGASTEATLASLDTEIGALDKNAGAVSATTRRVTLTDENIASISGSKSVLHSGYTAAAIPGNATNPLELVASTSAAISEILIFDTTGSFFEVMTGAIASEVQLCVTGPGNDQRIKVNVPISTRISIRRIDLASATTAGEVAFNLIG